MPRKQDFRKRSLVKAKNNAIVKRLMKISLMVDKYIYKHQPISPEQAELYMREVTSYCAQCRHDVRSMQVIEKLERCMQAIIQEQSYKQTSSSNPIESNIEERTVYISSPVYSMTDEDKTQFGNDCLIDDIESNQEYMDDNEKESNEIFNLNINNECTTISVNNENSSHIACDFIDINDGDRDWQKTEDVDIVDNVRNVGLNDKDESTFVESELYSQSILDNVPLATISLSNEACGQDMNVYIEDINNVTLTQTSVKETIQDKVNSEVAAALFNNDNLKKSEACNEPALPYSIQSTVVTNNNQQMINNTKQEENIKGKNKIKKANIMNGQTKKEVKQSNSPKDIELENSQVNNNQSIQVKECTSKEVKKTRNKQRRITKHKVDINWIQNIKYVREVDVDENNPDLNSLSELFWNNFDLPPCWDHKDLEYVA